MKLTISNKNSTKIFKKNFLKNLLTISLLIIISLQLISSKKTLKENKRSKTHSKSKTRTKGGPADLMAKIAAEFKKPENYFLFTLGVLSEFVPGVKSSYPTLKPLAMEFAPCFSNFEKDKSNPVLEQFEKMEKMFGTTTDRVKHCEAMKSDIFTNFSICNQQADSLNKLSTKNILGGGIIGGLASLGISALEAKKKSREEFCNGLWKLECNSLKGQLIQRFKNLDNYIEQCLYFHKKDCSVFNPASQGITEFAKNAFRYYAALKTAGTCIGMKLNDPKNTNLNAAKAALGKYFTNDFITTAAGQMLGVVANVMTFGVWGALKGAYYLVKLGFQIYDFFNAMTPDTSFKLGGIVGKAILIVKSIVLGRRRFLRKMK